MGIRVGRWVEHLRAVPECGLDQLLVRQRLWGDWVLRRRSSCGLRSGWKIREREFFEQINEHRNEVFAGLQGKGLRLRLSGDRESQQSRQRI